MCRIGKTLFWFKIHEEEHRYHGGLIDPRRLVGSAHAASADRMCQRVAANVIRVPNDGTEPHGFSDGLHHAWRA